MWTTGLRTEVDVYIIYTYIYLSEGNTFNSQFI